MSEKYKFSDPEGTYFMTMSIMGWIDLFTLIISLKILPLIFPFHYIYIESMALLIAYVGIALVTGFIVLNKKTRKELWGGKYKYRKRY